MSLSARRAWIEIWASLTSPSRWRVALRKESVDRNILNKELIINGKLSLSARRAWIEMQSCPYVHA